MEKQEIIESLLKAINEETGELKNELVKGVKINNITVTPQENYVRLGLTTKTPIKAYVADSKIPGKFELGENNIIFVSLYSIAAVLRDVDQARFAVDHMINNPESTKIILDGAKLDIIQEHVSANTEYVNPWSKEEKPKLFTHDQIINHVIDVQLSDFALSNLKDLAKDMMGIKH